MPTTGNGESVLIVEDQFLIALDLKATLQELGCPTVELAQSLEGALSLARTGSIHAALLDINLNGARSFAVASVLKDRSIPFAFLTGCDQAVVPLWRDNLDETAATIRMAIWCRG